MREARQPGIRIGEAVVLALPFLALILTYGFVTGKIAVNQWPPVVEMRAAFWIPVVVCTSIYFLILANRHEKRRGDWKWYREGLICAIVLTILWLILAPVYEHNVWIVERNKLGLSHP